MATKKKTSINDYKNRLSSPFGSGAYQIDSKGRRINKSSAKKGKKK